MTDYYKKLPLIRGIGVPPSNHSGNGIPMTSPDYKVLSKRVSQLARRRNHWACDAIAAPYTTIPANPLKDASFVFYSPQYPFSLRANWTQSGSINTAQTVTFKAIAAPASGTGFSTGSMTTIGTFYSRGTGSGFNEGELDVSSLSKNSLYYIYAITSNCSITNLSVYETARTYAAAESDFVAGTFDQREAVSDMGQDSGAEITTSSLTSLYETVKAHSCSARNIGGIASLALNGTMSSTTSTCPITLSTTGSEFATYQWNHSKLYDPADIPGGYSYGRRYLTMWVHLEAGTGTSTFYAWLMRNGTNFGFISGTTPAAGSNTFFRVTSQIHAADATDNLSIGIQRNSGTGSIVVRSFGFYQDPT